MNYYFAEHGIHFISYGNIKGLANCWIALSKQVDQ